MPGLWGRDWMDKLWRGELPHEDRPRRAALDGDGILRFVEPAPEPTLLEVASGRGLPARYAYLFDGLPHILADIPIRRLARILWWRFLVIRGDVPKEDQIDPDEAPPRPRD